MTLVSFGQVDGICDELKMCSRTHILGLIVFDLFPCRKAFIHITLDKMGGHLSATPSGVKWHKVPAQLVHA